MKKLLLISFLVSSFYINTVHAGFIGRCEAQYNTTLYNLLIPLTPIYNAIRMGNVEKVKNLIEEGKFDVNKSDMNGRTPLFLAVRMDNLEVVQLLIDAGANVSARDADGATPLHYVRNTVEIAKLLIKNGAEVEAKDIYDRYPIYGVVSKKVAEVLFKHGATVEYRKTRYGTVPFSFPHDWLKLKNRGSGEIMYYLNHKYYKELTRGSMRHRPL